MSTTTPRAELSTGEALVGLLEAYGIKTIFGIPGVHNVEMYRALPRSGITHILPRHEQGAGFMADGYARATGKPGVCFTITGPGLLNILTPLGQAWSDSSPVLVISSALDIAWSAQGRGRLHEMQNQRGAAASITGQAITAYTPADVRDAIAAALGTLASQRPRPAYVEIPLDLLSMPCGAGWQARALPGRAQPAGADLDRAAALLAGARNPVLVFGGGACHAAEAARALTDRLGAIALTTVAGKGIVPASHPLSLGSRLAQEGVKDILRKADVILAAGSELSETDFWDLEFNLQNRLIRIDIDPASLTRPHAAEVATLGDAAAALSGIRNRLPAADTGELSARNAARVRDYLAAELRREDDLRGLLRRVLETIRSALPQETVVVSDMTQIAYAANEIFPMDVAQSWIHPVGFGTLGFALPAAIGAKAGRPDAPVVALAGDYGFQYTINELGTAAELGQALPILLWNNDALGQIRDDMVMKGIQPNAVTLKNPDFQALARAYHCHAEKPATREDLARAIATAFKADRPTLIEMTPRMAAS